MNQTALVEIKDVYGNRTVYPCNEVAQLLADISGHKTLTESTIKRAKLLGFSFEVKPSATI